MILGVFHSKKNHQILTFFRFMRWIARFDTMNFRKEDLNLGRLQKLRKEVFPDAPGDYEKALFKHGMAHGRLPDGHLSHLTKRFCHRKKKACFSPRISRNTLKAFFFKENHLPFLGILMDFSSGNSHLRKKTQGLGGESTCVSGEFSDSTLSFQVIAFVHSLMNTCGTWGKNSSCGCMPRTGHSGRKFENIHENDETGRNSMNKILEDKWMAPGAVDKAGMADFCLMMQILRLNDPPKAHVTLVPAVAAVGNLSQLSLPPFA